MVSTSSISTIAICREHVTKVELREDGVVCVFANQTRMLLSRFLGSRVAVGDEIAFPVPARDTIRAEILITKNSGSGPNRYLYHVPIGYVSQPKLDKRNQHYVSAEIRRGSLGMGTVFLPCEVLREYFYRVTPTADSV